MALVLSACVSDHYLELELIPPRAPGGGPELPAELVSWELRVTRLEGGARCPTLEEAAEARVIGRLGSVQSFSREDGMGSAVGELPGGSWAVAAIGRDAACVPLLYGCTELSIDGATAPVVRVELAPVVTGSTCGCRACESGVCAPDGLECE